MPQEMLLNKKDIEREVNILGFLPFFRGEVEGFSIEERIDPDYWFRDEEGGHGVWDWKNDIILDADCAYGKLYGGKACFVSMEWYPDLVNYRRSKMHPTADEEQIVATVREHGSLLSRELKKLCGYSGRARRTPRNPIERLVAAETPQKHSDDGRKKGFDGAVTRLQMGCHLLTADFEYNLTRDGRPYGWSIARYCTPEDYFGAERLRVERSPEESRRRLADHLASTLPHATKAQIERIIN